MNKKLKITIAIFLEIIVSYLIGAFATLNINPLDWQIFTTVDGRMCSIFLLLIAVFYTINYYNNFKKI